MRLIDHIFIVPENTHFRTHINAKGEQVIEPVPLPWTLHKFYWALSLFSSWRGIGWNYVSPLSAKAYNHPYKRTSTRKAFIWNQTSSLVPVCILGWATKRYITTIGFDFFHGLVSWSELSRTQVFCHSLSVVVRVWWILNVGYIPMSLGCVIVGGVFGWKGEFWEPWGWPPIFGGLKEVWQFPGLSTVWSRVSCDLETRLTTVVEQRRETLVLCDRLERDRRDDSTITRIRRIVSLSLGTCHQKTKKRSQRKS